MKETLETETVSCPLGCAPDDEFVVSGRDRLHGVPGEFPVIRCRRCGLLRTSPRPTPAAIQHYYPAAYGPYASSSVSAAGTMARSSGRRSSLAARLLSPRTNVIPPLPPGRLLEIGCGAGAFLHRMAQEGWEVEGLELSPDAGEEARQLG